MCVYVCSYTNETMIWNAKLMPVVHWHSVTKVSVSKIRQRLTLKHQEIAEKLRVMLSKSVKDRAQVRRPTTSG